MIASAFAIAGWFRPDPLQPVAEVEQIYTICWRISPLVTVLGVVALAAAVLAPLCFSSSDDSERDAACALTVYFAIVSIAPFLGWFPVPLVGLGMSFPLGWWLGIGTLVGIARREQ